MRKTLNILALAGFVAAGLSAAHPKSANPGLAPEEAWSKLAKGNERFVRGMALHPHQDAERRRGLARAQQPWAVVVACADSRVAPEIIFDQGLGDLFVVRNAGNSVQGVFPLASIEYAVEHLKSNLVLILGHNRCGAVTAAVKGIAVDEHHSLDELAQALKAPVEEARDKVGGLKGEALVEEAVERNVLFQMKELLKTSPLVAAKVAAGDVKVVGGIYNLETGRVRWVGEHPSQAQVLEGKKP
jgi:carbonic anhydrase